MGLNKFIGMGRMTSDAELKVTPSGKSVTSFTIAIDRNVKTPNGENQTDFLKCVAWDKTAQLISRYFGKGKMVCVEGEVQTRSWKAQDGSTRSTTEINVSRAYFTGEKSNAATEPNIAPTNAPTNASDFEPISNDDDLPF